MLKLPKNTIFIILCFLVVAAFSPAQETPAAKSRHFSAFFPENRAKTAEIFLDLAEEARSRVHKDVSIPLNEHIQLVYCDTEKEFLRKSGMSPEHFLACASPQKKMITINGARLQAQDPKDYFSVLVHEYAHIYIGLRIKRDLPRWLNEGLAMHLAGEWSLGSYFRLSMAHIFGKLIPFSHLDASFPHNGGDISLAYIQSYAFTDFLMNNFFGGGGLNSFMRMLSDPAENKRILDTLWDPVIVESLERQWRKSLGGWIRNAIFVFTSTSLLWFALASLFILAYLKKRKKVKEQMEVWENEEDFYSEY